MSLIRSLVDGDLEGFRRKFESFLDRCPSFLHHVGTGRFLPVFCFSMFATVHDAGILDPSEKVYFRFDNHGIDTHGRNRNTGNLKVAVLTRNHDGQQVVRCYSISDRPNSDGLRFSIRERNALVREIRRQNPDLREEGLNFEQYKVCLHGKGKSQGEAIATVFEVIHEKDFRGRDKFAKYSASEVSLLRHIERGRLMEINAPAPRSVLTIKEIGRMQLDQDQLGQLGELVNFAQVEPGQQRISNFIEILASNTEENIRRTMRREILPYITRIYRNYSGSLQNDIQNRNQKFESHGVLLGFLANFSHLYTIDIDLDLSPGNSHVAFLVHRQAERENIPIVINLARWVIPSDTALNRAIDYAKRLHASSFLPVHTESGYAVCVGLNFNLNIDPFSVDTVELQHDRFPFVQRLFDCLEDEEIRENIRDFLLYHLPAEIPMNAENDNRIFDCITGFAFGSSAFDIHHLQLEGEEEVEVPIAKYILRYDDGDHALTMVFHAQGSDIVIFNIRTNDDVQQEAINLQTLNIDGNDVHVWKVSCILNNQLEPDIHVDDLGLYRDYHNINNFLDGDIVQVPNAENVHNTLNQVMNNDWQDVVQHGALFQEISRVLMPLRNAINVNSNDKFRSILHGVFYVCDNPDKVITGYAVGQTYSSDIRIEEGRMAEVRTGVTEQRLGLLLLRSTRNHPEDTHPIGYVLKFANDDEEVEQEQNEAEQQTTGLMDKQRGYLSITSGNEIVLSYAVFNAVAQRVEDLISVPQELYIHRFDRSHASGRTRGLVGPDSVIDENPPENLLSDITRKRLAGYFQDNQKQTSIPLFDLGNNRWVAVRYLEGSKERVIRRLTGTGKTPTEQEILQRIRAHRPDLPEGTQVHDLLTLEFATNNQFCRYWLQQHDIVDIARSWYDIDVSSDVVRELSTISAPLQEFRNRNSNARNGEKRLLTLIINLNNNHWIALVIAYQNGGYVGYYANSSGGSVPDNITDIIKNVLGNNVAINNVSIAQQRDSHNCGLWALENARDINQVLQQEHGGNVLNEIRNSLTLNVPGLNNIVDQGNLRNEQYFQNLRRSISEALGKDQLRQDNQAVTIAREYQDNMEIRELLLQFLELQYPQRGGGGTLQLGGERVISIDFGTQSALDEIDGVSRVYDCSKCKSGR